jgi:hypothetical protein
MFYKGDIVEVINHYKPEQVGKRYRITEVRKVAYGDVVVYEIGKERWPDENHVCFTNENIMLYNRPFVNKVKAILKLNNLD